MCAVRTGPMGVEFRASLVLMVTSHSSKSCVHNSFFLRFDSGSFRLHSPPSASSHLRRPISSRTTGLASSFKRARSSLRDLRCLVLGLACSRVPWHFLAYACHSHPHFPGIRGVEAARRAICSQARWGNTRERTYASSWCPPFVSCRF